MGSQIQSTAVGRLMAIDRHKSELLVGVDPSHMVELVCGGRKVDKQSVCLFLRYYAVLLEFT